MRESRSTAELLAAYVDGVSELTADERKRVEARLAADPTLRDDEIATRQLLGQLRELPPVGAEPDWTALERSISDAVGDEVPRPWWRRWRWLVPGFATVVTAAIILLVVRPGSDREAEAPAFVREPEVRVVPPSDSDSAADDRTASIYLDGSDIEIELDADDLDDPLDGLDDPELAGDELLGPSDLAWVDDLDDESLQRLEGWLDHPHRKKG